MTRHTKFMASVRRRLNHITKLHNRHCGDSELLNKAFQAEDDLVEFIKREHISIQNDSIEMAARQAESYPSKGDGKLFGHIVRCLKYSSKSAIRNP